MEMNNDDVYVVVIEHDNKNHVKEEILNSNGSIGFELLFENATKHEKELYLKDEDIEVESSDEDRVEDSDDNLVLTRQRNKNYNIRESLLSDLKKQFPIIPGTANKFNADGLVETIVELMKRIVTPSPPHNFFKMNGINFECCTCGETKDNYPAITRHYQERHGPRYLVCYGCGADFRSRLNLYKHEKRCKAPDMEFVLKARAIYIGRKARNRPFIQNTKCLAYEIADRLEACTMCSAVFKTAPSLHAHVLMHNGERPYKCTDCDAAYTSHRSLSRHQSKHNLMKYICDHCERVFQSRGSLIVHMDSHLPKKKFGCSECPKRFAHKATMLRHVDSVHRNLPPPFACRICSRRFKRMYLLKIHMKKDHGTELMTRKMFFRKSPNMTKTEMKKAKIVLNSDMNVPVKQTDYCEFSTDNKYRAIKSKNIKQL